MKAVDFPRLSACGTRASGLWRTMLRRMNKKKC
jgi:hypothetical protein